MVVVAGHPGLVDAIPKWLFHSNVSCPNSPWSLFLCTWRFTIQGLAYPWPFTVPVACALYHMLVSGLSDCLYIGLLSLGECPKNLDERCKASNNPASGLPGHDSDPFDWSTKLCTRFKVGKNRLQIWMGEWCTHTGRKGPEKGYTEDKLPQMFQDISPSEYPLYVVYGPAVIVGFVPWLYVLRYFDFKEVLQYHVVTSCLPSWIHYHVVFSTKLPWIKPQFNEQNLLHIYCVSLF